MKFVMPIPEELSYRARPGIQCHSSTGLRVLARNDKGTRNDKAAVIPDLIRGPQRHKLISPTRHGACTALVQTGGQIGLLAPSSARRGGRGRGE